jgi:glycosyltransferase involved in cell wall biosynthesis
MLIGFLVQTTIALGNPGNGVVAQARAQAEALQKLGHDVVMLNPWQWRDICHFDVVQFFVGGFGVYGVEEFARRMGRGVLVFAPIIDSIEPNWRYRLAAAGGCLHSKVFTVPGEFRKQARSSDLVICRASFEQKRVIKGLGIARDKTTIALNGVELPVMAEEDLLRSTEIRKDLGVPDEYLLHVSAYTQGRKNVARLIQAVGALGYPLVVAGWAEPGPSREMLDALAARYSNVRLMGFLPRHQLNALYAGCRVFCLPSLCEGTGLVALEAAAHGANIVITQNGGPPDYFKQWADYVDPLDVGGIREAIARAWNRPRTGDLRRHVAEHLTWEDSARALEAIYKKLLSRRSRKG